MAGKDPLPTTQMRHFLHNVMEVAYPVKGDATIAAAGAALGAGSRKSAIGSVEIRVRTG